MITIIIPALNEAASIARVVRFAFSQPMVTEVIVVDDGSVDNTPSLAAQAGARVIMSSLRGKGASLSDGLAMANNEFVIFIDGDMDGLSEDLVAKLATPLIEGKANFVKAKFARESGRVTTLTAKPLLRIFFPELAHFEQPLGGIIAAHRAVLNKIEFETDYGVDLGLLIDMHMAGESILEVDVGEVHHESQPLSALESMASQVIRTLFHRAAKHQRFHIHQLMEVEELERRKYSHASSLDCLTPNCNKIALVDMDGTIINGRFITELASATGRMPQLLRFLDNPKVHPIDRTRSIARIFEGVPMATFVSIARQIPLHTGAAELVVELRKLGYQVGIVSDSFRVATETIRRRVFADFSVAHLMRFAGGEATGDIELCSLMFHDEGCFDHYMCKKNVMLHISQKAKLALSNFLAIGDGENDICMLEAAGVSFAYRPKSERVSQVATATLEESLLEVVMMLGQDPARRIGYAIH